jgi:hypothetical protein
MITGVYYLSMLKEEKNKKYPVILVITGYKYLIEEVMIIADGCINIIIKFFKNWCG